MDSVVLRDVVMFVDVCISTIFTTSHALHCLVNGCPVKNKMSPENYVDFSECNMCINTLHVNFNESLMTVKGPSCVNVLSNFMAVHLLSEYLILFPLRSTNCNRVYFVRDVELKCCTFQEHDG